MCHSRWERYELTANEGLRLPWKPRIYLQPQVPVIGIRLIPVIPFPWETQAVAETMETVPEDQTRL
jgi:hypothetical protein